MVPIQPSLCPLLDREYGRGLAYPAFCAYKTLLRVHSDDYLLKRFSSETERNSPSRARVPMTARYTGGEYSLQSGLVPDTASQLDLYISLFTNLRLYQNLQLAFKSAVRSTICIISTPTMPSTGYSDRRFGIDRLLLHVTMEKTDNLSFAYIYSGYDFHILLQFYKIL
jgi:hypothetical protein